MSTTPQEFDLNAWLEDADRPERSVTVYQKPSLLADIDALEHQIENADPDDEIDGPSMGGGIGKLRAKYAEIAKKFHDSALVIRLKGHDDDEKQALADKHKESGSTEDLGCVILADAILEPKFTPKQVGKLEEKVGQAQFQLVAHAYHRASNEIPSVSADFLLKSSTPEGGGE
ncbi:hypothetical protein SAMN04487912_102348 [Arthrobacter sp. cf158]|uniref:hypothetical protein n=1 Tax=Arthrobacter sp. cf158 TaxID=1761744 RepID=UPI0008977AE7|nr:hypothetical protein [Arthrobacter sp. cf158]SDW32940.1 hypothetical protein SAMN04487912_102348 [Arthrobacter sp. cf158]